MLTVCNPNATEWFGKILSTDEKPPKAPNGAILWEFDSGKVFAFDMESETWIEQ